MDFFLNIGGFGGTVNPKKVGDMGIDGFTFMHRDPIQVKLVTF